MRAALLLGVALLLLPSISPAIAGHGRVENRGYSLETALKPCSLWMYFCPPPRPLAGFDIQPGDTSLVFQVHDESGRDPAVPYALEYWTPSGTRNRISGIFCNGQGALDLPERDASSPARITLHALSPQSVNGLSCGTPPTKGTMAVAFH